MDIQPTSQQSISDDQELAKVLAGVNQQADEATASEPVALPTPPPVDEAAADGKKSKSDKAAAATEEAPAVPDVALPPATPPTTGGDNDLESIKKEALGELRPLVDKLDVAPEEKFDTYLLLLRSTDDKALIAPAHDAARAITDEARRAQALLDIIKEIDFLSQAQTQAQ